MLAAGRVAGPAAGLDPTSAGFRKTLPDAEPQTVRIGDRSVVRYAGEQASGGSAWVALMPDDKGWTAVACRSAASDAALEGLCAPLAAGMEVKGSSPVDAAPDERLASVLGSSLEDLNAARAKAEDDLGAKGLKTRAAAARDVAAAHRRAADAISEHEARAQDAALKTALVAQLRRGGSSFERLADAATRKDRRAYNTARERVREADEGIQRAVKRLTRGGYETG
ncbi:MAG: hypothetical protein DYH12_30650 [Sorangiineae bacterium PRO1]|nr:hypothetical protein [Sorangiineae bacterium PRO1]